MCGLFLILAATLSFLDVGLFILMIPIIVLPILFASHIACYYLQAQQPITVSALFRYYTGFYHPQFRSSFRGIRSFLISLAVYFGGMMVCYIAFYAIYQHAYGATFTDAFTNLVKVYMSESVTYEDIMDLLYENNGLLLTFFLYVSSIPLSPASLWFLYSTSFASFSIYYRSNVSAAGSSLIRLAINNAYLKVKKAMRRDWFSLNWPILVLSFLGGVLGAILSIFVFKNITFLGAFMSLGSVTLIIFFLPFYFPNMEALYTRYENVFKEGNRMAIESILERIQSSIELSEEEKRDLEKSFKNDDEEKK